jgi:LDH2 family malate/lactate/ureidoglycolate dehydrogenase
MPVIQHTVLRKYVYDMYLAAGGVEEDARIVSNHVVDSNLVGHDSHGVINAPTYVNGMKDGSSANKLEIVRETPVCTVIDANGALGMVAACKGMELAIEKARTNTIGAVGLHQCGHAGRMGDYPPRAAIEGMIGIVLLNGGGQLMHPFGGSARRLPPNPIAIAVPRKRSEPLILDMTTTVVAGGKILLKAARNEKMPEGWMIDREGKPVTDPTVLREHPDDSAIMPLGGFQFGHKGFGLGFMIDAIAGGLSWAGCSQASPTRGASGIVMIAIRVEDFIDLEIYQQEIESLVEWVKSSPALPGVEEIYVPGEFEIRNREERLKTGIPIEEKTWNKLVKTASSLGVPAPQL